MRIDRRRLLFAAGSVLGLMALAAAVVTLVDLSSHKKQIEAAASDATGLGVRIGGKVGLSLFPVGISARDIRVSGRKGRILSAKELRIGIGLLPLLRKEVVVTGCRLVTPSLTIEKDNSGRYNFAGRGKKPEERSGGAFGMSRLKISEGTISYIDRKTNEKIELKDIDATVSDIWVEDSSATAKNISFRGKMKCKTVSRKTLEADRLRASFTAEKGVFRIRYSMDIFGGNGSGEALMDFSRAVPAYDIGLKVSSLDFSELGRSFGSKKTIAGKGEMAASLTMNGQNPLGSMEGRFSLKGDDLVIYTMDLDKVLSKLEGTQKFNLADLGAFLVAGPLGTAATRGYRYGDLYAKTREGTCRIRKLVSDWKIGNGVGVASDCALATKNHRVALKGKIDLANSRYDGIVVALLDNKGCAKFSQKISGPIGSPAIGAVSTVQSLASPILNLFSDGRALVDRGKCEMFYNGSVQPLR